MFSSNGRVVRSVALLTLATLVSCGFLEAQAPGPESRNLAWAQEFLRTLYPDIRDHRYVMTATTSHPFDVPVTSMGNLNIQIGEMAPGTILGITVSNAFVGREPPKDSKSAPIYAKQFIAANFGFDKEGHLSTFACEGPAVGKQKEYEGVKQLVGFHPEWTEPQVVSALLKAGASYGPEEKDKFLRVVPIDQLEKLFGKMTIASTEFETVTDSVQRFPLLHWVVTLNVDFSDGGAGKYRMFFEPFNGALTEMDAVSP